MVQTDFVCGAHLFTISVTFGRETRRGEKGSQSIERERRSG